MGVSLTDSPLNISEVGIVRVSKAVFRKAEPNFGANNSLTNDPPISSPVKASGTAKAGFFTCPAPTCLLLLILGFESY